MAKGSDIIVTSNPRGVKTEGFVSGTPKPGTVMQIAAATEPVGNRFTWEVYNADSNGDRRPIAVLLPQYLTGGVETAAYVDGEHCYLYFPLPGDTLNMIVANISGTSDTFAIGDLLMVKDAAGTLIAESSPQAEPFLLLETISTALTADTLKWVMFTGY